MCMGEIRALAMLPELGSSQLGLSWTQGYCDCDLPLHTKRLGQQLKGQQSNDVRISGSNASYESECK